MHSAESTCKATFLGNEPPRSTPFGGKLVRARYAQFVVWHAARHLVPSPHLDRQTVPDREKKRETSEREEVRELTAA
jgi:hypothetical protein